MRLSGSREDGRRAKSVGLSSGGFGYINEIGIYMAFVKPLRGFVPVIGENTFLADTAAIIGDVTVGRDCSIWFGAVLRGDVNKITIGDRVNIQDGVVVHTVVGSGSIVAANSLVLSRTVIEPGSVYAGVPAKRVKDVTPEQVRDIIERTARDYMMYASWYKE